MFQNNNIILQSLIKEKKTNLNDLIYITKFFVISNEYKKLQELSKLVLFKSFYKIEFNKKRMGIFLFLIELLTSQRVFSYITKKPIFYLDVRKNSIIGCKVILRNIAMFKFLDFLIFTMPQFDDDNNTFDIKCVKKQTTFFNFFLLHQLLRFFTLYDFQRTYLDDIQINFLFTSWLYEKKLFVLTSLLPLSNIKK